MLGFGRMSEPEMSRISTMRLRCGAGVAIVDIVTDRGRECQ